MNTKVSCKIFQSRQCPKTKVLLVSIEGGSEKGSENEERERKETMCDYGVEARKKT